VNGATAESVREAINRGDLVRALDLWTEYAAALSGGGLTEASLAEAAGLVEWSRPLLLCARAHAGERLRVLHVAAAYGGRDARPAPLVRASF
jgi:hypothetical protein